jgi:hypothetical protein
VKRAQVIACIARIRPTRKTGPKIRVRCTATCSLF